VTTSDKDPAQTLVEQALAALERDGRVDLPALCKDRPDLLPIVEAALACRTAALELAAPAEASERDPMIGTRLGNRYELLRLLGAGAMGAVYEARDTVLGRAVAAKVLHRSLFGGEGNARQRFQREARAAAALRHPGIVTVHDHDDGDPPYLIMDLVKAPDLKTIVVLVAEARNRRTMGRVIHNRFFAGSPQAPWDRPWPMLVAALLATASRAVAAAHAQGVVHRDLKPSNLLVRADASALVVDFGLARIAGDATLTKSETVVGSPSYMSPEQAAGLPPTPASDIYSLGATLYHTLALRPPFIGDVAAVLTQVQRDVPMPVQRAWPGVPRDLAVICQKAMAREPADRYGSANELAEDFEAFLALRPIKARPLSWPKRAVRWARRRPAQAAIVVLALVLAPVLAYATDSFVKASVISARTAANLARRHVPAVATLDGRNPAENLYRSDRKDVEARKALDAVLAADPRDEEALAMRAMLHSDEGRRDEALADLRALSAVCPDAKVLAAATAAFASGDPGPQWPLLPDLPEARTALDHFLLGYWCARDSRYADAATEIEAALQLDEFHVPSLHLQLLVFAVQRDIDAVRRAVSGVEKRLGGPTARTLHAQGVAWAFARKWEKAAGLLAESVKLATSAGTLRTLAIARRNLNDREGALALLEQAAAVRPEARGVFLARYTLLRELGRDEEANALKAALPDDSPVAQSMRAQARGGQLLVEAMSVRARGEDFEPMRIDAEAALTAALAEATPDCVPVIKLDLVTLSFLRDGDHQKALDAVIKLIGSEAKSAKALHRAWYYATGAGMPSVARHYLEQANAIEPTDRDCAQLLANALLDDKPPDPARALQVLAAAYRTRADWEIQEAAGNLPSCAELARRAIELCIDAGVLQSVLPALANAAETGLFAREGASDRLVTALRTISKNPRSLPPSLSVLLSR